MGENSKNGVIRISGNTMIHSVRANHEEIFSHLEHLVGKDAVEVAISVAQVAKSGDYATALQQLKTFDSCLGGIGIYKSTGVKLPGIYRALSYVEFPFIPWKNAIDGTRGMIHASCAYLEGLIKKMVWLWPWEIFRDYGPYGMPLGTLAKKIQGYIPDSLYTELAWLNKHVYVFAKHQYDLDGNIGDEVIPEHYFELDEAIAVYLMVRKLGLELERLSKKPEKVFTRE